jgi:hypothetical protein
MIENKKQNRNYLVVCRIEGPSVSKEDRIHLKAFVDGCGELKAEGERRWA